MTNEELKAEIKKIESILENPDPSVSFVLTNALKQIKENYETILKQNDEGEIPTMS